MNIYIDLESIPLAPDKREFTKPTMETMKFGNTKDPEKKQAQFETALADWETGADAALDATTGQVVLIGMFHTSYWHLDSADEPEMLNGFWTTLNSSYNQKSGLQVIGHNILPFDIPFLARRSMILGVKVPSWVLTDINQYKPEIFQDTMRFWQFGDRRHSVSLKTLCGAFGIEVKNNGVTGADFWKWWEKDKEACIAYNRQDVEAVKVLWERMHI